MAQNLSRRPNAKLSCANRNVPCFAPVKVSPFPFIGRIWSGAFGDTRKGSGGVAEGSAATEGGPAAARRTSLAPRLPPARPRRQPRRDPNPSRRREAQPPPASFDDSIRRSVMTMTSTREPCDSRSSTLPMTPPDERDIIMSWTRCGSPFDCDCRSTQQSDIDMALIGRVPRIPSSKGDPCPAWASDQHPSDRDASIPSSLAPPTTP